MLSTRLIIKNLPNSTTEAKLRQHFSEKGSVTDVQLKRFPDGTFRHFAFVGYRTEDEAEAARAYFDKTFFGASRIQVENCYALNDPNKPRAWSKHSKEKDNTSNPTIRKGVEEDSNEDQIDRPKKKRREEELLEKAQTEPEFLEFLQVHNIKDNAKWGNDTVLDDLAKLVSKDESKQDKKIKKKVEVEDKHQRNDKDEKITDKKPRPDDTYFYVKLRNLPKKARKKDLKAFFAPIVPKSIRVPSNNRGFAYIGFLTEVDLKKALSKNRSIMLGNQICVKKYVSQATMEKAVDQRETRWKSQSDELAQTSEGIHESGRIFVRNLTYNVTEDELKPIFESFGPITEVHVPVDRLTRQCKGFAFVSFLLPEHAAKAFEALDGTTFQGRLLHLLPAKSKDDVTDGTNAGSSYKREKQQKMKKTAGSSHNWNALFLGQNAVSSVVSDKYGVSREQLLLDNNDQRDDRLSSVAVRMALAETEIVSDTKKFLEAHGVCLEAFELQNTKAERSSTAILVKNLVANTTEVEIRETFEKRGVLGRVVMPPSGVTAIVEFMVPAEARGAFKKLAYSKFKSMPLYLEWAPVGCFRYASDGSKISVTKDDNEKPTSDDIPTPSETVPEINQSAYEDEDPIDDNMVPEPDTTLFVKNLNFSTVEDDLKAHFSTIGRVFAATVAKRKDPKNPGQMLSQGFGFVQFYRESSAAKALKQLNQSMLKNHVLELKMSSRTLESENKIVDPKKQQGTKMLVRNVPFQATEEEVTDLFKVFGKLKAVRMPKKLMGESQHRGFAFIEFFLEANAKAAFDTLSKSTHMYGRRLVLEWAQKDESVDELREKVAKKYNLQLSGSNSSGTASTKKQMRRYFDSKSSRNANEDELDQDDE